MVAAATAVALAGVGLAASPASATATVCQQDGVAELCASSIATQDVLTINYQVTQFDGPGTYSAYYVSESTSNASTAQTVGPLGYQGTASSTFHAAPGDCYDVHLDSSAGTSLVTGPVCG
jgi:hypothetical protein